MTQEIRFCVVAIDSEGMETTTAEHVLPCMEVTGPRRDLVIFWTLGPVGGNLVGYHYMVFRYDDQIPDEFEYVGTAGRDRDGELWHLFRRRT
jgi:hypothetical protein